MLCDDESEQIYERLGVYQGIGEALTRSDLMAHSGESVIPPFENVLVVLVFVVEALLALTLQSDVLASNTGFYVVQVDPIWSAGPCLQIEDWQKVVFF